MLPFVLAAEAQAVAAPPPWVTVLVTFITVLGSVAVAIGPKIFNARRENKEGESEQPTRSAPPPPVVSPDGSIDVEPTIMRLLNTVGSIQAKQEDSDRENRRLREELFQLKLRLQYAEDQHYQSLRQIITWAENNTNGVIPAWIRDLVTSAQNAAAAANPKAGFQR